MCHSILVLHVCNLLQSYLGGSSSFDVFESQVTSSQKKWENKKNVKSFPKWQDPLLSQKWHSGSKK